MSVPCVLFALGREAMFFRRNCPFRERICGAPCPGQLRASSTQTILMLETGLGAAAMETALLWCLTAHRPSFVLSAGFSGALEEQRQIGDLIAATEIVDRAGNRWPTTHPLDEALPRGRLLTMPHLVGDPQEKQRLGREHDAAAVDMESASVARLCHEHGVPFACLRVISDDWNTPLSPHLIELLRHGRVSCIRFAWAVLRHPSLCGEFWRLAGQTRRAAKRLAEAMRLFMD